MIKCVVDTNIFINAMFSDRYRTDQEILDLEESGQIKFVFSDHTANELFKICARFVNQQEVFECEEFFTSLLVIVGRSIRIKKPQKLKTLSSDKGDQPFIELAVAANADYLITNDMSNGLLTIKEYDGVKIVKPAQIVRELRRTRKRAN